jgi:hypothetical protein
MLDGEVVTGTPHKVQCPLYVLHMEKHAETQVLKEFFPWLVTGRHETFSETDAVTFQVLNSELWVLEQNLQSSRKLQRHPSTICIVGKACPRIIL